jgi:hypothetical protein
MIYRKKTYKTTTKKQKTIQRNKIQKKTNIYESRIKRRIFVK